MTDKQANFVRFLAQGHKASQAAKLAGYQHPDQEAVRLKSQPKVLEAAFHARQAYIQTEIAPLACDVIHRMIESEETPAKVRLQACVFVLQAAGHTTLKQAQDSARKELHEMSLDELTQFIEQQKQALSELKQVGPVVECPEECLKEVETQ